MREFQDLQHTTKTVAEFTTKFRERSLLVPQYAVDEEIKKMRYDSMLRDNIRDFVSFTRYKTLNDMVEKAREWETELELRIKRKLEQVRAAMG